MNELTMADVTGFRSGAVAAGIKKDGAADLALVVSDRPATAAGMFTRSLVRAAPVLLDEARLAATPDDIRGVLINAGNANAVTGPQGAADALQMVSRVEAHFGLPAGSLLVMSTGVIGVPLPMARIERGIDRLVARLGGDAAGAIALSEAIMTTDTVPKRAAEQVEIGGRTVTVAGTAKGSGMIHPDMATLLSLVVTDLDIAAAPLRAALQAAVDRSFHAISVDGDTSTNDSQIVLANGAAANPRIEGTDDRGFATFRAALTRVCTTLARKVAFDGEGATRRITIQVRGTRSEEEARTIGRVIATSPLVKTAIYGRDANWGRILAAAGRAGVPFRPEHCALWFGDLQLLAQGQPLGIDEARAIEILEQEDVTISLAVGDGPASACVWTCDLTPGYIQINAAYRT